MSQDNASFTFLHRIEEVELNIEDGRWQSALALALTLPDICGGIAFPEIVKRYRDGRAVLDRNQRPTRDVGNQYIRWFDTYAAPFFKVSAQDISPYICGERCWQLRCEYLHQNKGFANTEDNTSIRFHLGVNCGTSVCQLDRILSRICKKVIVVHRRDTLKATKIYHEPLMKTENVEFLWDSEIVALLHNEKLTGIRIRNLKTEEESTLACDGVFVSVGRKPSTELVKDQITIDPTGYIIADESTRTNIPGVFAVGDVRTKALRQVVTAVADGATAVHYAEEYLAGGI